MSYDQRLERLLRTAARVFATKGYHPTSMRDLARATGMSLAGIYYYVQSKEELLFQVLDRCFEAVLAGARLAVEESDDPQACLEAFVRHHVTFFARHMDAMKVLSHEAEHLSGHAGEVLQQKKRVYVELLERVLEGVAPGIPALDRSAAAYGLFGMMNWIYTWYDPTGPLSPGALSEQFTRVFLNGFATHHPSLMSSTTTSVSHGG